MKKFAVLLLICCLLVGCGKSGDTQGTTVPSGTGSTTQNPTAGDSQGTTVPSGNTEGTTAPSGNADGTTVTKPTAPDASEETTQPTKPTEHTCEFGPWLVKAKATCGKEGREERTCPKCYASESRPIAKTAHTLGAYNVCKTCSFVDFDPNAKVVELGVLTNKNYSAGNAANTAWDVKIWNGKVFRGSGDYDKNAGKAPIFAYDIASQTWISTGVMADQAIHRFAEIDGKLMAPGIDPTGSWSMGNYYVLNDDGKSWETVRNLPEGIHNFDMMEFDGKIFAALGTEDTDNTVAVSADGGKSFTFVPMYMNGKQLDTSGYKYTRTYDFAVYNNQLYALIYFYSGGFDNMYTIFRYENGKMVYVGMDGGLSAGIGSNRNHWNGKFEFGGACYLTAYYLYAITDFADQKSYEKIEMPNKERVADALVRDGVIYTLCYKQDSKTKEYNAIIYKSATGKAGSFEEVVSYTYPAYPCSFDTDGTYFYVGTGTAVSDTAKAGMVLRINPAA